MKIRYSIVLVLLSLLLGNEAFAITEAYFPYNPRTGAFGFSRSLDNQKFNYSFRSRNNRWGIKTYVTDLSHVTQRYGLMIWISDPDATITVKRIHQHGFEDTVELEVLEVTSTYKIVDVMDPTLKKILITITSPHRNETFSIIIMAICE